MSKTVYLNGAFVPREDASIDIEDRGYQFADAVYEVVYFSNGTPFRLDEHFDRLRESASALEINLPDLTELKQKVLELKERNGIGDHSAKLYLQVSRGTQERHHEITDELKPNVVMTISQFEEHPSSYYEDGASAITVPDDRWARCHIKTTALASNALAKTRAREKGCFEALFVRDGYVTEGTSSNVFVVQNGVLTTPPPSNYILNGVTRRVVLECADEIGLDVRERSVQDRELFESDEVLLTGTTTHVMPVVEVDETIIGSGRPGEITTSLMERYQEKLP